MPPRRQTDGKRYLLLPLLTLLLAIVLRLFVFDVYWVETSPIPELIPHRSWLMVYRLSAPRMGDLILFSQEGDKPRPSTLSRVVAIQGDTIESSQGRLYINGIDMAQVPMDNGHQIRLNTGEVWVLNPPNSDGVDSRHFGAISQEDIIGRIILHLSL